MKNRLTHLALALVALTGFVCAQGTKIVEPTDILDLRTVSDPQISPDAGRIVFVVNTPQSEAAKANSHIWIVDNAPTGKQRPFIISGSLDTAPRWSADGRLIAFLSTRPNALVHDAAGGYHFSTANDSAPSPDQGKEKKDPEPEQQLWLLHIDGGEAEPLTNIPGGIRSFKWMPGGKAIAFVRRDPEPAADKDRMAKKKDWNVALENHVFDRLWIYSFDTQQARLVTKQNLNVDDFTPSPDGSQFLIKTSPTPLLNDVYYLTSTSVIGAATGQVTKVVIPHGGFSGTWSPDGRHVVVLEQNDNVLSAFPKIYDLQTGNKTRITTTIPSTLGSVAWSADGKFLTGLSDENSHVVLQSIDIQTGGAKTTQLLGAVGGRPTYSRDGKTIAFICSRPDHPGEVCVFANGQSRVLTEFNPQVKDLRLGKSEEVSWKSSKDGLEIHGVLVYPADYIPGQKYKTVLHIHGGPIENWLNGWNASWYNPAQYYASHGFAVLLPMIRGSAGSGPEFEHLTVKNWGDADFQDALDGIDTIVKRGIADPDRLVIGGWSYGGYTTAWAITHTHRFKAAMVGAGISDLFTMGLTTDIAPSYLDGYFGPVIPSRKLYDTHSAISYLDQVTTPTLILHGEADPRVPVSQSHELFNGLRFLYKEVQMVTYPREPHIFTEREHQIDSLTRMLTWYDSHVQRTN